MGEPLELTKIERELVLQYLRDDNVPLTVTLEKKPQKTDAQIESNKLTSIPSNYKIPVSEVFPVAISSNQMEILKQGIILLKNTNRNVEPFLGKQVRVQFYFNHLGLYFITEMKNYSGGLAIVVPQTIYRIQEETSDKDFNFTSQIWFKDDNNKKVKIETLPLENYTLLQNPIWGDIAYESQKEAKAILEEIVEKLKSKELNWNHNSTSLICISRYLSDYKLLSPSAIKNRIKPLSIIYLDNEHAIFGCEKNYDSLVLDEEYNFTMTFGLSKNKHLKRTVETKGKVDFIYQNEERTVYSLTFTDLKPEDNRFIYEQFYKKIME